MLISSTFNVPSAVTVPLENENPPIPARSLTSVTFKTDINKSPYVIFIRNIRGQPLHLLDL